MNRPLTKIALVAMLVGAALAGERAVPGWDLLGRWIPIPTFTLVTVAFGIFNVLVTPPGTTWIRAGAVLVALAGCFASTGWSVALTLVAWFVWPPAFMAAWALGRERADALANAPAERESAAVRSRITLAVVIGAVAVATLAYRILVAHKLDQTAALFIGLPALTAIVVVVAVSPKSATGVACKATTVGLLASAMFLWEGALCVLMSAPLFYTVAVFIAAAMDAAHRRRDKATTTLASVAIVLVAAPMSLEGVTKLTTIARAESVTASKVVHAPAEAVARALAAPPRFDRPRPWYTGWFPAPVGVHIGRNGRTQRWVIAMRGGEMFVNGMEPRTGDLTLDLEDAQPGRVRWRAISDTSHMTHFLTFREALVEWQAIDASTTKVTWTLRYDRGLDPAWYFGPMERYVAEAAAGYLIDAVATP